MRKANWLLITACGRRGGSRGLSLLSRSRRRCGALHAGGGYLSHPARRHGQGSDALGWQRQRLTRGDRFDSRLAFCSRLIRRTRFPVGSARRAQGVAQGANGNAGQCCTTASIVTTAGREGGAQFSVKTTQGSFSFSGRGDSRGDEEKAFLDGRVVVDRVPTMARLTDSTEEQDFPAIAQSDDMVYLSYVEFVHANRELEDNRATWTEAPEEFRRTGASRGRGPGVPDELFQGQALVEPTDAGLRAQAGCDADGGRGGRPETRLGILVGARRMAASISTRRACRNGSWSREIRISSDPGHGRDAGGGDRFAGTRVGGVAGLPQQ